MRWYGQAMVQAGQCNMRNEDYFDQPSLVSGNDGKCTVNNLKKGMIHYFNAFFYWPSLVTVALIKSVWQPIFFLFI